MSRRRYFGIVLLSLLSIVINGCSGEKTVWEWGRVTKISGTLPGLVKSSGAIFGNESVRLGDQTLVYTVKVNDSVYTIDIPEAGQVSRVNLMTRVCVGTYVSFPVRMVDKGTYIANPNVGAVIPSDMHVPVPCSQ